MFKMKLSNVDKLDELCNELVAVTFLQGHIIIDDYIDYGEEFSFIYNYARQYLFEKQEKIILELHDLIHNYGFETGDNG